MTQHDEAYYLQRLDGRGIKPTAIRLLLLRAMMAHTCAFSLQSLEQELDTVDKSTIYRTIMLFLTQHLIHAIDDGSGSLKYAVCSPNCHCGEGDHDAGEDLHAHFRCERCNRTFCLKSIHVPVVTLPGHFEVHSVSYVLKGLCEECAMKMRHDN